ncbi:ABC transporter ATP-binding protein [Xanthomonas campestris]|uniref:ABC transporter ATP-binding protein n=1 Tax=Xanthomonas campestris TaxID=339 RepID=UPI001CD6309C|nr:ABC transporter ATP-binding protein [Xanthomonas campestris]MCC5045937.1 ABC transporter ATP-binding protein [Xanthomonas campestris]MCC5054243.1 ABC transporter ATP-binding protein [Xanthomonas campestris]MCC5058455.1 ABC transporter ATP-binding protein [Xanthomonas campestris]MEB1794579.1 ABC transporter ATP-binding protein [Xanthomonas campestris pv. campestris]
MSCENAVITVDQVSKRYEIYAEPSDRFKQMAVSALGKILPVGERRYFKEFWALHGVSLQVQRGECVALIGRNGSGKSTLLQIIASTVTPTTGTVSVNGRVAALLELGSGFNPEFTGLENVYLNASLLGLSRQEVDDRLDAILAFADIGEFVNQPVRTYSSGMTVRLAFAVQAQIDPDVLIVDEALAVGDARFQAKCFARLKSLRERGTSILLVTHSTEQVVTHCDRAILIDHGQKLEDGAPRPVVNLYLDLLYGRQKSAAAASSQSVVMPSSPLDEQLAQLDSAFGEREEAWFASRPAFNPYEHRWGDGKAEFLDFALFSQGQPFPSSLSAGAEIDLYLRYRCSADLVRPILGITLKTKEGLTVYGTNTEMTAVEGGFAKNGKSGIALCRMKLNCAAGDYFISVGLASRETNGEVVPHDRRYDAIHLCVETTLPFIGITDLRANLKLL